MMDSLNTAKYEQAILFFAHTCNNAHLGKTKLMKLLYYLDFDHFEQFDQSVTGDTYYKYPHGPVPSSADTILDLMARRKLIERAVTPRGGYTQHRIVPLVEPDLHVFSATERETLQRVCERWKDAPKAVIEAQTHREAPWLAVEDWEEIPYDYAYYRNSFGTPALAAEHDRYVNPESLVTADA